MTKPRVYVDSGILILASKAKEDEITKRALEELERDDVDFLFSRIVELETIPQPTRNSQYSHQLVLLMEFFNTSQRVPCNDASQQIAIKEASKGSGLKPADALHVGSAVLASADYILTTESLTLQLGQCQAIEVRSIFA
jgi:predicted nucleic acid-binding protein